MDKPGNSNAPSGDDIEEGVSDDIRSDMEGMRRTTDVSTFLYADEKGAMSVRFCSLNVKDIKHL